MNALAYVAFFHSLSREFLGNRVVKLHQHLHYLCILRACAHVTEGGAQARDKLNSLPSVLLLRTLHRTNESHTLKNKKRASHIPNPVLGCCTRKIGQ
jgi:hypothetical protein